MAHPLIAKENSQKLKSRKMFAKSLAIGFQSAKKVEVTTGNCSVAKHV